MMVSSSRKTLRKIKTRIAKLVGAQSSPRPSGVMDLRKTDCTPIEAVYGAGRFVPLVDVPASACRGFQYIAFPLAADGPHPFVRTLIDYQRGDCLTYSGSALAHYHTSFIPTSACEALGLSHATVSERLLALRPLQAVLPWWPTEGATAFGSIETARNNIAKRDYTLAGHSGPEQPGVYQHGPFSAEQGEIEFNRLIKVYEAIRADGFRRDDSIDGDIRGVALVLSDGSYRIMLHCGQHRASALAALGHHTLPVRLTSPSSASIIRRDDVAVWPYVRTGLFSREAALEVFDRIFAGIPSSEVRRGDEDVPSLATSRSRRAMPLGQTGARRLAT
jgi:hypothetical protein